MGAGHKPVICRLQSLPYSNAKGMDVKCQRQSLFPRKKKSFDTLTTMLTRLARFSVSKMQ